MRIIYLQGIGFISEAILFCQSEYTKDKWGVPSLFSHILLEGDDGKYYDSTVEIIINYEKRRFHIVYGVRSIGQNKLNKLISKSAAYGMQYIDISDEQWKEVTKRAQYGVKKGYKYGGIELFGTLITLIKWKFANKKRRAKILAKENPFNTNDVYCISFVADCFLQAGLNFTDPKIDTSNLVVDEGWHGCLLPNKRWFVENED